jgi:hypothetical protein
MANYGAIDEIRKFDNQNKEFANDEEYHLDMETGDEALIQQTEETQLDGAIDVNDTDPEASVSVTTSRRRRTWIASLALVVGAVGLVMLVSGTIAGSDRSLASQSPEDVKAHATKTMNLASVGPDGGQPVYSPVKSPVYSPVYAPVYSAPTYKPSYQPSEK